MEDINESISIITLNMNKTPIKYTNKKIKIIRAD